MSTYDIQMLLTCYCINNLNDTFFLYTNHWYIYIFFFHIFLNAEIAILSACISPVQYYYFTKVKHLHTPSATGCSLSVGIVVDNIIGGPVLHTKLQPDGEGNRFLGGRLRAQRGAVWGGCERKLSWAGMKGWGWRGIWAQPWSLVQLMALTEAGLWPYRGESWREKGERGEADWVCLHTEVCCPLDSLQHMAKALGLTEEKK